MNNTTLQHIRHEIYACFEHAGDALFNLVDALVSESQTQSLPRLSLYPFFERKWPSVYEALEDGHINVEQSHHYTIIDIASSSLSYVDINRNIILFLSF